jgi:hypothetical protein
MTTSRSVSNTATVESCALRDAQVFPESTLGLFHYVSHEVNCFHIPVEFCVPRSQHSLPLLPNRGRAQLDHSCAGWGWHHQGGEQAGGRPDTKDGPARPPGWNWILLIHCC